ncbi:hypothetical protein [Vibrio vulnificus]|nr:hypothetical protein [Vibrio vulnificus]
MLPTLAEVLAVSVEELISQLPQTKQKFVSEMLDIIIQQQT